jgi:Holliday junction resolvase RusA-like endonuclease
MRGRLVESQDMPRKNKAGEVTRKGGALKRWRESIRAAAKHVRRECFETGPVIVDIQLYFSPPKSKKALPYPRPDVDKLTRAVLDALTGVAYKDDSQVVQINATKHYLDEGGHPAEPGARIHWETYTDDTPF